MDDRPIGVFDSGVGGVSVLRNMARLMPRERFIYYGDNQNAPYGTREKAEISKLALNCAAYLLKRNVKALVIACNTATSATASELRSMLKLPVIGMEPALKPASLMWRGGTICVLATPTTLKLEKFNALMRKYGEHARVMPCAGLMEFVERGETEGEELNLYLERVFAPLNDTRIDSVVLGCTHYIYISRAIRLAARGARLVDGNEGTARHLKRVLEERNMLNTGGDGGVEMHTSGDADVLLPLMRRLFDTEIE